MVCEGQKSDELFFESIAVSSPDCYLALGPQTLFGCPQSSLQPVSSAQFTVYGVPTDIGCTEKPGCRFGPTNIRAASLGMYSYCQNLLSLPIGTVDEDYGSLLQGVTFGDVGDLVFHPGENPASLTKRIRYVSKSIRKSGSTPILLGGDHSVSYGAIAGLVGKSDDLVILHFDAHTDLGELVTGRHHHHGNVFARVLRDFPNARIAQFGIRGQTGIKPAESSRYVSKSATQYSLWNSSWKGFITEKSKVYITLDIDVLDPFFAPGVGTPVRSGITPDQLFRAIGEMVAGYDVVGIDLVEVNPLMDRDSNTSQLAAEALMHLMTICAK